MGLRRVWLHLRRLASDSSWQRYSSTWQVLGSEIQVFWLLLGAPLVCICITESLHADRFNVVLLGLTYSYSTLIFQ